MLIITQYDTFYIVFTVTYNVFLLIFKQCLNLIQLHFYLLLAKCHISQVHPGLWIFLNTNALPQSQRFDGIGVNTELLYLAPTSATGFNFKESEPLRLPGLLPGRPSPRHSRNNLCAPWVLLEERV